MNKDIIEGKWAEIKGKVKTQWAKLTDDDLDAISGRAEELIGRLQKQYGWAKDRAKKEADDFRKTLN